MPMDLPLPAAEKVKEEEPSPSEKLHQLDLSLKSAAAPHSDNGYSSSS
jgi:hypothetical protein